MKKPTLGAARTGGAKRPAAGGAKRPAAGGAKRPAAGGAKRPAAGGAKRPAAGGAKRPATGGAKRPATGGATRKPSAGKASGAGQDSSARSNSPRTAGASSPRPARSGGSTARKKTAKTTRSPERTPRSKGKGRPDRRDSMEGRNPNPKPAWVRQKAIPFSPREGLPIIGEWLLTTREGSEVDQIDELTLFNVKRLPRKLAPGLVVAPEIPKRDKRPVELTFARQGFPVGAVVQSHDLDELAMGLAKGLKQRLERAQHYGLQAWVPDTTEANPLASMAEALEKRVADLLEQMLPEATRVDDSQLRRLGAIHFAQICLLSTSCAAGGVLYSNAALSLARGGRTRIRLTGELPSRAARKVEEALAWIGVAPGPGEVCVDLGAAPGGWTFVLAERRARVIAIDPAKLRPDIAARKNVHHIPGNAFTYTPEEKIDWLFCDMAYRPLEVAALLAKWGRKRWARMVVANIKLPMTKKAEILARIRKIMTSEGEWKHLRTKQLYHDRDEITLTAHVG